LLLNETTTETPTPGPSDSNRAPSPSSALKQLELLPAKLLQHAREFNDHIHFFTNPHAEDSLPPSLRKLLDEIAEAEKMDSRVKKEFLEDDEARRTLLVLGYQRTLQHLIETAETTVKLVLEHERDHDARNTNPDRSTKPAIFSHHWNLRQRLQNVKFVDSSHRPPAFLHQAGITSEPELTPAKPTSFVEGSSR
jgi:hypothetical protein